MSEQSLPSPSIDSEEIIFAAEDNEPPLAAEARRDSTAWKVVIADDDREIHNVTQLALRDFQFAGRSLVFLNAYSGREARDLIAEHPDTALILLDVIMENEDAGLQVVRHIRETLGNVLVRIVLRTGQPGQVPEKLAIATYDINDYKTKSELTAQKLFTTMVTALRSFETLNHLEASRQESRAIAAAASRFVPRQFLQILSRESLVDIQPGDSIEQTMSILFADIRNFTLLSEQAQPAENFAFINSFFSQMEPAIAEHNGFIDKYIGDAIMALFRGSADNAVRAAIAMSLRLKTYNSERAQRGEPPLAIGIGINTGTLILGMVGSRNRLEGTAIGDAVNVAARIEQLTKHYGSRLLISQYTFLALDDSNAYDLRLIDCVRVSGRLERISIFEVFNTDSATERAAKQATKQEFEQAVLRYHAGDYASACEYFEPYRAAHPSDRVAQLYCERCRQQRS